MPSTGNAFTLLQAPAAMKDKLPDSTSLIRHVVAANKIPVKAYEENAVTTALLDKEPTTGKVTAETINEKLGTTNLTLSNGITISIKPTKLKNDEIQMDAWRWGGSHKYPLADKENAENAAILYNRWVSKTCRQLTCGNLWRAKQSVRSLISMRMKKVLKAAAV